MQHCILVKWTPDAGDKDALAKGTNRREKP